MVSIWPYSEILKERIINLDSHNASCFLKKKEAPQPGTSSEKSKLSLCHNQKIPKQGHYSGDYKNITVLSSNISNKCEKFNFLYD